MKKLTAMLVTAIMLLAVMPLATVAALHEAGEKAEIGASADEGRTVGVRTVLPEEAAEIAKERHEKAVERFREAQEKRAEVMEEAKEKAADLREKIAEFREKTKEEREKHREELKERLEEERKEILKVKDTVRECKDRETEQCHKGRIEAKVHAKEFLSHATEQMTVLLERAKERVEASELDENVKAELLAAVDAQIEKAVSTSDVLASIGEESTPEEIKGIVHSLREVRHETVKTIQRAVAKGSGQKLGGIIVKVSHLEEKLEKVIARLKEQGRDTAALEAELADFRAEIARAKNLHETALALTDSKEPGKTAEAMKQAITKMREAHKALKEAHNTLKSILKDVKQIGGERALETGDDEEAETA